MTSPLNNTPSNNSTSPISRSVSSTPPPQGYISPNFLDSSNRMRVPLQNSQNSGEEFENVTQIFERGCQSKFGLKLGELVHSPYFGLLDAMAACEIMDPKMDSGYQNLNNLLNDYNINIDLSYNNLLGILDKLFSLQIEWFFGNPPLQTLFTSYYFHYQTPQLTYASTSNNLIFSYIHLIRLSSHFISNQIVEEGQFYEGEDFSNQLPHNVKWSQVPSYDELKWVQKSEDLVINLIDGLNIRDPILDLIITRFKLQLLILKIFYEFYCSGNGSRNIDKIREWTFESLELLRKLDINYEFSDNVVNSAFNFNLSNLISGQVPPRPIEHWEFSKVKQNYKSFLKSLLFITNLNQPQFGINSQSSTTSSMSQFSGLSLDKLLKSHSTRQNCTIIQIFTQSLLINRSQYFGSLHPYQFIPLYIEWFNLYDLTSLNNNEDYLRPIWNNLNSFISESIINETKNISRQRRESNKLIRKWEQNQDNLKQILWGSNLGKYFRDEELTNLSSLINTFLNYKKFVVIEKILNLSFILNLVNIRDFKLNLIYLDHILNLNYQLLVNYSGLSKFRIEDFSGYFQELDKINPMDYKRLRIFVIGLEFKLKLELVNCLIKEIELINRYQSPSNTTNSSSALPPINLPNYDHITYRNRFRMFNNLEDKLSYSEYLNKLNSLKQMSEVDLKSSIIQNLENCSYLVNNLIKAPSELKGLDYLLKVENDKELERYNQEIQIKLKTWNLINSERLEEEIKNLRLEKEESFPYLSLKTEKLNYN